MSVFQLLPVSPHTCRHKESGFFSTHGLIYIHLSLKADTEVDTLPHRVQTSPRSSSPPPLSTTVTWTLQMTAVSGHTHTHPNGKSYLGHNKCGKPGSDLSFQSSLCVRVIKIYLKSLLCPETPKHCWAPIVFTSVETRASVVKYGNRNKPPEEHHYLAHGTETQGFRKHNCANHPPSSSSSFPPLSHS